MHRGRRRFCIGFFFALSTTVGASHTTSPAHNVSGDLIVKFTAASETGMLIARVQHKTPIDSQLLTQVAVRLSTELQVPLLPMHVTSGQELVLAIARPQVAHAIKQQLTRRPGIRSVKVATNAKSILPPDKIEFIVECSTHCPTQVPVPLRVAVYPPLSGQAAANGEMMLTLDLVETTRALVAQLKGRPDVSYAQTNQMLRP